MDKLSHLEDLERRAELGGGEERLRRHQAAGKLTARQRIDFLFDAASFQEVDKLVTHRCRDFGMADQIVPGDGVVAGRSEEHTSELQSRLHLVCRLLLEKKKKNNKHAQHHMRSTHR